MNPAGVSSTWWVTSTVAGVVGSAGQQAEPTRQVLAGPAPVEVPVIESQYL